MLKIIAVHHVDRPDRLPLPDGWDIWETDTEIGQTYSDLANHALDAEWGHDVVIVQDDVRFLTDPNEVNAEGFAVVAYGQTRHKHHICPRAFSADKDGWKMLGELWSPNVNTLCTMFTHAIEQAGIIFDITGLTHD